MASLTLSYVTTVASLYSSCLAVSWTFLKNTSMSSVLGSKVKGVPSSMKVSN